MSVITRLTSFFLATSLLAGACTPAMTRGPVDAVTPIAKPEPQPSKPAIDRATLRAALAARRETSVERFLAYRENRVYPINTYQGGFQHVWLDSLGNLCAAATIIAADWGRQATWAVSAENNFIRLADVHDGPLADWILTSGLTRHEVVAIQAPPFVDDEQWQVQQQQWNLDQAALAGEVERLYALYTDVERQLDSLWDESLEDAVDDLMERPDLARQLLDGVAAGPGRFGIGTDIGEPALIGFVPGPLQ